MNTATLLTLVATIIGVKGSIVQVDIGSEGGLRSGDSGIIYFEVAATDHVHTVDVGPATVLSTTDEDAELRIPPGLSVKTSHLVRFEIPEERLAGVPTAPGPAAASVPAASVGGDTEATEPPAIQPQQAAMSADISQRFAEVEAALQESERTRQELSQSLDKPAGGNGPGNTELDQADQSVSDLQQQLLRSESELAEAQAAQEALAEQVIERTVEQLERRLDESQSAARDAEIARRALQSEVTALADEIAALRVRLATAETLRDEAVAEQERLRTELEALRPVSSTERRSMEAEAERRESELAVTRSALDQAEARILELERQIEGPAPSESSADETAPSSRKPRWKFWKRSSAKTGDDVDTAADEPGGTDNERP